MLMKRSSLLAASAALALTAGAAQAETIIYQDDFSGGAGDLNGENPDIGANPWVATPGFDANGNVNVTDAAVSGGGSATLAFTPVDGLVYTLDVSLGAVATTPDPGSTVDESWVGLGFANGQSAVAGNNSRFITTATTTEGSGVIGRAWTFVRGSGASGGFGNTAFLGDGFGPSGNPGLADGENWSPSSTFGGNVDLRIVLDTTDGAGTWTATWLVDTGSGFAEVRGETLLLDEGITSVGLAVSSNGVTSGVIESFSLTSVPEPGSLALIGLGGLLVASRRRRN